MNGIRIVLLALSVAMFRGEAASTGAAMPSQSHPLVGKRLPDWREGEFQVHFIYTGVAQLARELGVPPLRLGRHFTAELGHPPGEEILRQRLAKARTLLRETGLPLARIAELCGFCHASYPSNVFHRATGLSPREWRNAPSGD